METITKTFAILTPIIIAFALKNTPTIKGIIGELKVRSLLNRKLNRHDYSIINDIIINDIIINDTDDSTQVDHIIVSKFGIFVIETKNMRGWIFGSERHRIWTQQHFYKKTKFQNPLHQNYKHIKFLEKLTGVGESKIYSIVVFTGKSEFKTEVPVNVITINKLIQYIKDRESLLLSEEEVNKINNKLNNIKLKTKLTDKIKHILNVERRIDGSEYINTISNYQIFTFILKSLIFKKILLSIVFIVASYIFITNFGDLTKKNIQTETKNLTNKLQQRINKEIIPDKNQFKAAKSDNYKGAIYSWTTKDNKRAFSNIGFPTDESYTDGKIELNQ